MRALFAATGLFVLGTSAVAQVGPSTLDMACGEAREIVLAEGAIVLRTGPITYDRYVSSSAFCIRGEWAEPAWVPSADTPQCFIGYVCRQADIDRGD